MTGTESPCSCRTAWTFWIVARAVFLSALDRAPSPGYITRLREGLGLTQAQLGARLGVDKLTVSRWERGTMRPGAGRVQAIEKLRKAAIREGVTIGS